MELVDREKEVLRTLEVLSKSGIEFVVVGGYAVSALTRHRFSVDCDAVVRNRDLNRLGAILRAEGFSKAQEQTGFDKVYSGRFISYVKKVAGLPISVDLFVNSLVCRRTDGAWSFHYVLSHSIEANVPGIQPSAKCRIPKRELLMAFKLHAARKPDVRDVVMLSGGANWSEVLQHLDRGDSNKLRASVRQVLRDLSDGKLVNSLKGVFSLKEDVTSNISTCKKELSKIRAELDAKIRRRGPKCRFTSLASTRGPTVPHRTVGCA